MILFQSDKKYILSTALPFMCVLTCTINREKILKCYVDSVKRNYDYVLIDSMPSLGMLTMNSLTAANSVIVPTQPHFLSAKGLELLTMSIGKIKRLINPQLKIDGILMTMVNSRANFSKDLIELIRTQYGGKINVFNTVIPQSIRAVETSAEGVSIYSFDKNGSVANAYQNLTKEVIEIEKQRQKCRTENVR